MKKIVKIEIIDPAYSKVLTGVKTLEPCLSYRSIFFKKGQYRKIRKERRVKLIKNKLFLTGFINRIEEYCLHNRIELSVKRNNQIWLYPEHEPSVGNLNISKNERSYQEELVNIAVEKQRGIIKAATASGKTAIMLGIISCFDSRLKTLFLSDTHIPISQFKEGIIKYGFQMYDITCSTVQSFYKQSVEVLSQFDIVLIDEAHSSIGFKTMYQKLLEKCLAPMRLGFTATLPNTVEQRMALEGLIGPVIGEYSIQEGTSSGVLAKVKIKLGEVIPKNQSEKFKKLRRYKEIYREGVVNYRAFNRIIARDIRDDLNEGRIVLVLVQEIQHGLNIQEMAKKLYGLNLVFVQGSTDADARDEIRVALENKFIKAVIATAVFRKALNIPSLDVVTNACGGKSEVMILQMIGRGLRKPKGKEQVIIRDYFNPSHNYFISHFGYRFSLYCKEGWV